MRQNWRRRMPKCYEPSSTGRTCEIPESGAEADLPRPQTPEIWDIWLLTCQSIQAVGITPFEAAGAYAGRANEASG
jgi:hypothetical protein